MIPTIVLENSWKLGGFGWDLGGFDMEARGLGGKRLRDEAGRDTKVGFIGLHTQIKPKAKSDKMVPESLAFKPLDW